MRQDIELIEHLKVNGPSTLELIHTMANFLIITDFEGRVLIGSNSFFNKTSIEKEWFYEQKFSDLLYKSDDENLCLFDILMLSNKSMNLEIYLNDQKKEEPIDTMLVSASILKNFFNNRDYVLILLSDVREQKKAQLQMLHSNKMASLGEMATSIAHEINNPLSIMQGQLKMLNKRIDKLEGDLSKPKAITEKIERNIDRITKIVKSLRVICRKDEKSTFEKVSILKIFEGVSDLTEQKLQLNSINFSITGLEVPEDESYLYCHETEVMQVFVNLINNAVDAIDALEDKWLKVEIKSFEDKFKITVTDSGSGIPLEVQIKLFEPFYTTKDIGKGTGLGLNISKGLIESHNGSLSYDNECANTRFVIELPKNQDIIEE